MSDGVTEPPNTKARLDIGIAGIREIEKWLPRDEESTARERLRQLAADRDEAWRSYRRLEEKFLVAVETLEYMGGAELVVDDLRNGVTKWGPGA